jgi:Fur family ferric uptake transcriptional regulator
MTTRAVRSRQELRQEIERHFTRKGIRMTPPRAAVVDELLEARDHVTADELADRLRRRGKRVSKATVYRTLTILKDSGLFDAHDFGTGARHYEPIADRPHHDHMYCIGCGKIEEFSNDQIERLQERIARRFRFRIVYHSHKLFGYCADCDAGGRR